jgi:transcriptional regulator with XRE-family HTH domain
MLLAQRLRQARKSKKLTQEELANRVSTTKGTISNYENGHSSPPNEMLVLLAETLDTTTDYLLGRTEDPSPRDDKNQNPKKPSFDDLDLKETENLFFFNRDGMSDEDIEKVKEYIELLRLKAKQHNEKHNK